MMRDGIYFGADYEEVIRAFLEKRAPVSNRRSPTPRSPCRSWRRRIHDVADERKFKIVLRRKIGIPQASTTASLRLAGYTVERGLLQCGVGRDVFAGRKGLLSSEFQPDGGGELAAACWSHHAGLGGTRYEG